MNSLQNAVLPFSSMLKVPVSYLDANGQVQWVCSEDEKICRFCSFSRDSQGVCRETIVSSARIAAKLGEPYIFLCSSGLVKIMITLIAHGKIQGYFAAGPIAMGNNKENNIRNMIRKIAPEPEIYAELTLFLNEMRVFSPKEVGYLASLLNSTIMGSVVTVEDYRKINENYREQVHFGEQIQKYKKQHKSLDYPHELEDRLINKVKNGDAEGVQETLLELLNEISLVESGDLSAIKVRALGICAVLTRISKRQYGSFEISPKEIENMDLLNKAETFKEICAFSSKICENLCVFIPGPEYRGRSQIVLKACQYIREHYMERITLKTVSGVLYTNASYLSSLFKKETGISFTEYLNDVRLKRALDLLINTNLGLLEISLRSGFDCQSYCTKVFKRKYGITPREYRKTNRSIL